MGFSLGSILDPSGAFSGDKGDFINNILDPMGGAIDQFGLEDWGMNGLHEDVGEWMDDLGDTNEYLARNRTRNVFSENGLKRDAQTGFSGWGGSPIGTTFTNKVWSQEDRPMWDMYGNFTPDDYAYAQSKGQDTSAKEGLHSIGGGIGKGFINAATFGLGSTALDGLNAYGYGDNAGAEDILKKAGKNYAATYLMSDYANVDAGDYSPYVNGAIKGTVGTAAAGGNSSDIAKGALQGAGQGGVKSMFDTMPDEGTMGGTMTDEEGENSATLGGQITPIQSDANVQRAQAMSAPSNGGFSNTVNSYINSIMGGDTGKTLGSLADFGSSMYGLYNARKQRNALRQQQANLQQMFGPESPYAQQMRQRLERKDAAGGRRSQYGPREAQLAALLADRQAQTFPHQMALQGAIGGYDNQMVNAGFRGFNQGRQLFPQLLNMFNSGG
jgi:hypothetical protein